MMNYKPSLEERKRKLIEDCVGCGGGDGGDMDSDIGDDTAADAVEGPQDQLDKALEKLRKKKKKKVTESKKPLPVPKMIMKASQLSNKPESNKDKMFKNLDRARKIRNQVK